MICALACNNNCIPNRCCVKRRISRRVFLSRPQITRVMQEEQLKYIIGDGLAAISSRAAHTRIICRLVFQHQGKAIKRITILIKLMTARGVCIGADRIIAFFSSARNIIKMAARMQMMHKIWSRNVRYRAAAPKQWRCEAILLYKLEFYVRQTDGGARKIASARRWILR